MDPRDDEPHSRLAQLAGLSDLAGGGDFCGAGVQLFLQHHGQLIAAPFSGLLAEQLEARLTGEAPPDTGIWDIMKDLPRIMKREWQKLAYYLPRALLLFVLYFIPVIGQTAAPVLWFLFSAWMLADPVL